jgi:hypothetical protein
MEFNDAVHHRLVCVNEVTPCAEDGNFIPSHLNEQSKRKNKSHEMGAVYRYSAYGL